MYFIILKMYKTCATIFKYLLLLSFSQGGQIIRMAVCFSALLKKPIKLIKIRAGRQKGGLAAQHLKGESISRSELDLICT